MTVTAGRRKFLRIGLMTGAKEKRLASVQAEILAERAAALRLTEDRLNKALAALAAFDQEQSARASRDQLRAEAAEACLTYVVQREAMGSTAADLRTLRADLGIPDDVWNAMGSARPG
jgi:hypothetical protein